MPTARAMSARVDRCCNCPMKAPTAPFARAAAHRHPRDVVAFWLLGLSAALHERGRTGDCHSLPSRLLSVKKELCTLFVT